MLTGFNWHFHAYRRFRNDLPDSRRHFKTERAFGSRSPDHGHCIDFGGKSGFWSKYKFITTTDDSPTGCETPVENVRISEELTVNNSVATTPAGLWSPFSSTALSRDFPTVERTFWVLESLGCRRGKRRTQPHQRPHAADKYAALSLKGDLLLLSKAQAGEFPSTEAPLRQKELERRRFRTKAKPGS